MTIRTQLTTTDHHAQRQAPLMNTESDRFRRAVKLHQQGELSEAAELYEAILRDEPDHLQVIYLTGLMASQTGQPERAITQIEHYLQAFPNDAQAISILGLSYFDLKDYASCVARLERAIELNPAATHTLENLAKARFMLEDYVAARSAYEQLIEIEPKNIEALTGLALCYRELGEYEPALGILENVIVMEPMRAESHFFYGNVLRDTRDFADAIDAYAAAVTLKPDYLEAYVNCASCLKDIGKLPEAMAFYEAALSIDPDHAEANYNRSLALLSEMKLEAGWRLYERRLDSKITTRKFVGSHNIRRAPDWDGHSAVESLLVIGEQGLGDQIFFGGMLPDLARKVAQATVILDHRLVPLFERAMPMIRFIGPDQLDAQTYDAQIHLGSLGRLFRPDVESLEQVSFSYLRSDPAQRVARRAQLKQENKLLCGLSWLSKNTDHGEGKSLSLQALLPVLNLPSVDFVDLQYGDTEAERLQLQQSSGVRIHHLDDVDNTQDLDGLAALIDACDLVVTVSNTTAHLSAALGKPVIVMLPDNDALFWYWHRDASTTPWYPTARLFRRSDTGSWDTVIDTVALTLAGIQ